MDREAAAIALNLEFLLIPMTKSQEGRFFDLPLPIGRLTTLGACRLLENENPKLKKLLATRP